MASFNKIQIVGFLGKDVETRFMPDGTAVASFSVATTEKYKKDGEWQEKTLWFKVNVWGKQGEACAQYLAKGSQVFIDGRLSVQEYADRDGNQRTSLEVRANDVQFLDRKPQGDGQQRNESQQANPANKSFSTDKSGRVASPPMDEDDPSMPF